MHDELSLLSRLSCLIFPPVTQCNREVNSFKVVSLAKISCQNTEVYRFTIGAPVPHWAMPWPADLVTPGSNPAGGRILSNCKQGPEVIKKFSCSTQLSMKFFLLINVKMPTIVGIFTFMSRQNSLLVLSESEKTEFLDIFLLMSI